RLYLHSFPTRRSSDLRNLGFRTQRIRIGLARLLDFGLLQVRSKLVLHVVEAHARPILSPEIGLDLGVSRSRDLRIDFLLQQLLRDRKSTRLNSSHDQI